MAMRETSPPLTLAQAAQYLNVSERYMRRLVAERRVPFHKIGRLLRFLASDLDDLLEAGRVESSTLLTWRPRRGNFTRDGVRGLVPPSRPNSADSGEWPDLSINAVAGQKRGHGRP